MLDCLGLNTLLLFAICFFALRTPFVPGYRCTPLDHLDPAREAVCRAVQIAVHRNFQSVNTPRSVACLGQQGQEGVGEAITAELIHIESRCQTILGFRGRNIRASC